MFGLRCKFPPCLHMEYLSACGETVLNKTAHKPDIQVDFYLDFWGHWYALL
jgi:hypothetical protein